MPKSASGYLEHYFFSLMRAVKQSMILKSSLILEQDELKADFNLLTEDQLQIVKKKCIIIKKWQVWYMQVATHFRNNTI